MSNWVVRVRIWLNTEEARPIADLAVKEVEEDFLLIDSKKTVLPNNHRHNEQLVLLAE